MSLSWDPTLARRLRRGLPLTVLGQTGLPAPLSRLLVLGRSDGGPRGRASLAAVLVPSFQDGTALLSVVGLGRHPAAIRVPTALGQLPVRAAPGEGLFVLDRVGAVRFLVAPGIARYLTASCGLWPILRPLLGGQAPPRPLAGIAEDLDAFCELLDVLLETVYREEGIEPPSIDLVLRVTEASVETALAGFRRLGQATDEVRSRLAPGSAPLPPALPPADEAITFDDVGGQDAARAEMEAICLAVRRPEAFKAWGTRPPRGVLLHGPPGTGKTLLARALANESGAHFFHVRATDVVSKWYGEAEQRLQQIFDQARSQAPSVIFFDEIDALAREREVAHEATHRIVSTFLENLDGLRENEGVIVLAATNRLRAVDDALLRPGRFDRIVEVPLPTAEGRRAILRIHLDQARRRAGRELFEPSAEANWEALLAATDGFSGADLAEVVRRALEARVRSGSTSGLIRFSELMAAAEGLAQRA
jgi:hypothetical protein